MGKWDISGQLYASKDAPNYEYVDALKMFEDSASQLKKVTWLEYLWKFDIPWSSSRDTGWKSLLLAKE